MIERLKRPLAATGFAVLATAGFATAASATDMPNKGEAQHHIVGQTGTGTPAAVPPGDPIYNAAPGTFSGVVGLQMRYAGGTFVCSGALLSDRQSILTAAHCVSGGRTVDRDLLGVTAFFRGPNAGENTLIYPTASGLDPSITAITGRDIFVNGGYTGNVVDQNDIAIIKLSDIAPDFAQSYDLYMGDLQGQEFTVAGYGTRSATGGDLGTTNPDGTPGTSGPNRLRQGTNRYDFAYGDAAFNGLFTSTDLTDPRCTGAPGENWFCTNAQINNVWIADFDNGEAANDASCLFATNIAGLATGNPQFCNRGTGAREVSTAGGDSGGPQFVNGQISSVTSFGQSFGAANGDFRPGLQSSWGEFNGFVPTSIHADFIRNAMAIPEPSTWAMMLAGFGLVGAGVRRRERKPLAA